MRLRTCLLFVAALFNTQALVAEEYVLRFERLVARSWRENPEDGQVLLRYEMTVRPDVPFRCGLVAGSERLLLSGVVTPHAESHVELALNTHISIAGKDGDSRTDSEGWSNRFELALNLDEPATARPASGRQWKLRAGKVINSRSVAREAIRVLLFESPRAADQGLQLAAGAASDPAGSENYTVRISQIGPTAPGSGKDAPAERERLALLFDAQLGVPTIVRCAFGTTECVATTQLLPSQPGRLRADTNIAFMEHEKSFFLNKLGQPQSFLRQLSARTTVHSKLGDRTSIGGAPLSPGHAASAGLCLKIDALPAK